MKKEDQKDKAVSHSCDVLNFLAQRTEEGWAQYANLGPPSHLVITNFWSILQYGGGGWSFTPLIFFFYFWLLQYGGGGGGGLDLCQLLAIGAFLAVAAAAAAALFLQITASRTNKFCTQNLSKLSIRKKDNFANAMFKCRVGEGEKGSWDPRGGKDSSETSSKVGRCFFSWYPGQNFNKTMDYHMSSYVKK